MGRHSCFSRECHSLFLSMALEVWATEGHGSRSLLKTPGCLPVPVGWPGGESLAAKQQQVVRTSLGVVSPAGGTHAHPQRPPPWLKSPQGSSDLSSLCSRSTSHFMLWGVLGRDSLELWASWKAKWLMAHGKCFVRIPG